MTSTITKKSIHTTIPILEYIELIEYGKGTLNAGISEVLRLVRSKKIVVLVTTEVTL